MRALQIVELTGPQSALRLVEVPEPEPSHMLTPGAGVVVEVHAAGVSFPEVLQTRGEYQVKPPLPFVPGSEVAGIVRSSAEGSAFAPGDRVAAFCMLGGFAELAVAPEFLTFALPDALDFAQGAGLILNYHTAYFALVTRGRLAAGETVLVHGAAGGVGTASLQVAKGLGARTIAVVSTSVVPTGKMVVDTSVRFPELEDALAAVNGQTRAGDNVFLDAQALSERLFDDHMPANMIAMGAAFQRGALPVSSTSMEAAV